MRRTLNTIRVNAYVGVAEVFTGGAVEAVAADRYVVGDFSSRQLLGGVAMGVVIMWDGVRRIHGTVDSAHMLGRDSVQQSREALASRNRGSPER